MDSVGQGFGEHRREGLSLLPDIRGLSKGNAKAGAQNPLKAHLLTSRACGLGSALECLPVPFPGGLAPSSLAASRQLGVLFGDLGL